MCGSQLRSRSYLVARLHPITSVSDVVDVTLRVPDVEAIGNLRSYKNHVGSQIREPHIHKSVAHFVRSNVPLEEMGHPVDSVRKLAAVSAVRQISMDYTDLPPTDILESMVQICIVSRVREAYVFCLLPRIIVDNVWYESLAI